MAMDKATCARKLYDIMVSEIVVTKADELALAEANLAGEIIEGTIANTSYYPVDDAIMDFLHSEGMTVDVLMKFGFLGNMIDEFSLNVRAIRAALKNSPGPGPAPV